MEDITGASESAGQQGITVRRTFALLRALGSMHHPVGVTRLALEAGIAKTTAHRLLEQLADENIVVRRDRKWALGVGLRDLDRRLPDLGAIAHARVTALTQRTGATVFLYAKSGDRLAAVSRSYGPLISQLMPPSDQIVAAEDPGSAMIRAIEVGHMVTGYGEYHPACNCIATPFELPSGDIAVLALASTSRRDVDALKPVLLRNALLMSTDIWRLASWPITQRVHSSAPFAQPI